MTPIMDECFSSPRRLYTRQCTHSTKPSLTITTCKSVLPSVKLSCAMVASSNCDFASLHTWWHWPSSPAFGESLHLSLQHLATTSGTRRVVSRSRLYYNSQQGGAAETGDAAQEA